MSFPPAIQSHNQREVIDFRIPINMINNASNIPGFHDVVSCLHNGLDFCQCGVVFGFFDTFGLVLVTRELDTGLSVAAKQGQACGHTGNRVATHDVTLGFHCSDIIEMSRPFLVPDAWCPVGCHPDVGEDLRSSDIDVRNDSKPSTQTDACDVKSAGLGLLAHFPQVVNDFSLDVVPHVVVCLLHLAFGACAVLVDLED